MRGRERAGSSVVSIETILQDNTLKVIFCTEAVTHRRISTQTRLHANTLTHRRFYTQTFSHTYAYTSTHTLSHRNAFTHRRFCTQMLFHTEAFTYRSFYTQTLLHTDAFTSTTSCTNLLRTRTIQCKECVLRSLRPRLLRLTCKHHCRIDLQTEQ